MKFKDWFSVKAVKSELKHVTWLTRKELVKNVGIVLAFCLVFGLFFYASDGLIAVIMKWLRIG